MKILVVLSDMELCNGMVSYAMNYYRILKENCKIDFLYTVPTENTTYIDEIRRDGNHVYKLSQIKYKTLPKFMKEVKQFFKKHNDYDIVHCHVANTAIFYLSAAKKYGIKVRIIHAHATTSSDKFVNRVRNDIMQPISNSYATDFFACSQKAGEAVFGKKDFCVIRNAIVADKYLFTEEEYHRQRELLGLGDKLVVGTVGRMSEQKNPIFILKIIKRLVEEKVDFKFLYIGNGHMQDQIDALIEKWQLGDYIQILQHRTDVNLLYQAMDIFILPSLFEGLPVVGIEAQCSGVPSLVADTITKELKILDTTEFLPIESEQVWVDAIKKIDVKASIEKRKNVAETFRKSGYDINTNAKLMQEKYEEVMRK